MDSNKKLYGGIFATSLFTGILAEKVFPGYGKDILYGVQAYSGCRFCGIDLNPLECAVVGFVSNSLGELCQYFGLFPGTFDQKDFLIYVLSAPIPFGIEKFLREKEICN